MSEFVFSDHIVFVDESGDHGLVQVDPHYPMFVLAFCLFSKVDYVEQAGPILQRLKLRFWGHDEHVLHEHEIRKPNRHYGFLFDPVTRSDFQNAISGVVEETPFQLVASAIRKVEFARQYAVPANPYELSLEFGLERLLRELQARGDATKITHVVVERRGTNEDAQLELAFRRICAGANALGRLLPFELVMVPKASNSTGLQLADLVARPIGIKVLRPSQPNRAYDVVEKKFRRSPAGEIKGWGLKVFP
jgi:hypothetical protein